MEENKEKKDVKPFRLLKGFRRARPEGKKELNVAFFLNKPSHKKQQEEKQDSQQSEEE